MTTATAAPPPVKLLTAEEYAALPDDGRRTDLVRGRVIERPQPKPAHGYICQNVGYVLNEFVKPRDLGRVVSNDSGVITERDPDSMRGMDVGFYSYERVPRGPLPTGYWPAPELVVEVKSGFDRWRELTAKATEYLAAGVLVVWVLDPEAAVAVVHTSDDAQYRLTGDDELTLPGVLPEFRAPVRRLFE